MTAVEAPLLVTMADVRAAHGCRRGALAFCLRHNLDWMEFLRVGIPAETLLATGDAMAARIVEVARGRK